MPNGEFLTKAQSAADWAIASAEDLGLAAVAARGWRDAAVRCVMV